MGYMNKAIDDVVNYKNGVERNADLSPELKHQIKVNCAKRVVGHLSNMNKAIENFETSALGCFDQVPKAGG